MKNVLIVGDSYSTYTDYIPEGYETWYTPTNQYTDVKNVDECWWKMLMEKTGDNLVLNDSWSGTTICNTGYEKADVSEYSFIARFDKLAKNGFFDKNKIDIVYIFGGTNDTWAESPVGEISFDCHSKENLYNVLPAVCYLFKRVKEQLPNARVINIMNDELKPEIISGMKSAAAHYNVECVELKDIGKENGHPSVAGMKSICEQVFSIL